MIDTFRYFVVFQYSLLFFIFNFQNLLLLASDNPVKYPGIEQELSNNAVTSIYQDHNGFRWFGTYDWLNRYAIEGDNNHSIWVGSQTGLSIYGTSSQQRLLMSLVEEQATLRCME